VLNQQSETELVVEEKEIIVVGKAKNLYTEKDIEVGMQKS
jgi:hypothetical protein